MRTLAPPAEIIYPESDGLPMADNTLQYDWIVLIVGELRDMFAGKEVFVAGNLFWYPVQGKPKIVSAPDGMIVFGRPAGYRGSYRQWEEDNLAPQVVFEVYSPKDRASTYKKRLEFFQTHGVEEYYFIDPYEELITGYRRSRGKLMPIANMKGFTSPRLGVTFDWHDDKLVLIGPDGRVFQTREEKVADLDLRATALENELRAEKRRVADERKKTQDEQARAEAERQRAETLLELLRSHGIDPEKPK